MEGKDYKFHERLKHLIHQYVHLVYKLTDKFPSDERFGLTSQARRAGMSVMLNYVEGYSRMKLGVMEYQFESSYGSLKESIYVLFFGMERKYITSDEYKEAHTLEDEIGAMLYSTIEGIKKKI